MNTLPILHVEDVASVILFFVEEQVSSAPLRYPETSETLSRIHAYK